MPIWHLEFKESELERDENNEHFLQVNAVMHFLHNSQYKYRLVMVKDKQKGSLSQRTPYATLLTNNQKQYYYEKTTNV